MHNMFEQERKTVSLISFAAVFICILFLTVISFPDYWKNIIYERSPLTWVESLILFSCSLVTFFNFLFLKKQSVKLPIIWLLLSCVFMYLSLDERFMIHEGIREKILKPNHIQFNFLFWVEKGDYVLFVFMAAGISLLPFILKELRSNKSAFLFYITGMIFSAFAVLTDSIDLHGKNLQMQFLIQYAEEMLETSGMLCFLNSFTAKFFEILTSIAGRTLVQDKKS